jgi:hypothetical protein
MKSKARLGARANPQSKKNANEQQSSQQAQRTNHLRLAGEEFNRAQN